MHERGSKPVPALWRIDRKDKRVVEQPSYGDHDQPSCKESPKIFGWSLISSNRVSDIDDQKIGPDRKVTEEADYADRRGVLVKESLVRDCKRVDVEGIEK